MYQKDIIMFNTNTHSITFIVALYLIHVTRIGLILCLSRFIFPPFLANKTLQMCFMNSIS